MTWVMTSSRLDLLFSWFWCLDFHIPSNPTIWYNLTWLKPLKITCHSVFLDAVASLAVRHDCHSLTKQFVSDLILSKGFKMPGLSISISGNVKKKSIFKDIIQIKVDHPPSYVLP